MPAVNLTNTGTDHLLAEAPVFLGSVLLPPSVIGVPADCSVDVAVDVTAALNKFANRPGAPIKARVDVELCALDGKINITDVTRILDGFRNLPFPFTPGGAFGCTGSDPCSYSTMSAAATGW